MIGSRRSPQRFCSANSAPCQRESWGAPPGTVPAFLSPEPVGSLAGEALLSPEAETALKQALRGSEDGDSGAAAAAEESRWVSVIHSLLQQPFPELRLATYRLGGALALRGWAAAEICASQLKNQLCNPASESGQQGCEWRFAMLQALAAGLASGADTEPPAGGNVRRTSSTAAGVGTMQELLDAIDLGPYGSGRHGSYREHFVASVPR
mmetsp:Transcript_37015/g.87970  ORF Transcript_37015/g.87970 Transcript_37015/m.87970 type:complete len:209 (-) Transcript_37015:138-764(-)